jgi:hypothetical protein
MPAELANLWLVGPGIEDAPFTKPRWLQVHEDCRHRLAFCDADMHARRQVTLPTDAPKP